MDSVDHVGVERRGRVGVLTLDRPAALNALSEPMARRLDGRLAGWLADPAVGAVVIRGAGDRAFCAGGDVRAIGALPDPDQRRAAGRAFFGAEYRLNHRLHTSPKPVVALLHGVIMGGGLGLSVHGSHRVVDGAVRIAMPETVLGLFPDVGASWFLHCCPGMIGRYLALAGPTVGAADALTAGLATHHVPRERFETVIDALAAAPSLGAADIDRLLDQTSEPLEPGLLAERQVVIDRLFAGDDLDAIVARLRAAADRAEWIADALATIDRACPTSLRATWRRMVAAPGQSIGRVLTDDYRMAVRMVGGADFAEGVRAILIDKDQAPRWSPATLAEVEEGAIEALLRPLDDEPAFD